MVIHDHLMDFGDPSSFQVVTDKYNYVDLMIFINFGNLTFISPDLILGD
jgi:hypothetical protein